MQRSSGETYNTDLMDTGREKERVRCMERITYIAIHKMDSQWEIDVWLRKLKQELCINLEGWDGEADSRGEAGSRGRGHMYT